MQKIVAQFCTVASLIVVLTANAQQRAIDIQKSNMTVHVYRAGVFSAFGHDHEIAAPISGGAVDTAARAIEMRVNARALTVRDQGVSDKDRAEIQNTMIGPDVLDTEHFPEVAFRSTSVAPVGPGAWRVQGSLALHGQTRPINVEVRETDGYYIGSSRFKQTDFGIEPVRVAAGTIRVKDEVLVEFDIRLQH